MSRPFLLSLLSALIATPVGAEPIRVATWNLLNLHHETGVPLRTRAVARTDDDYAQLRTYLDRLDADIVAVQEVNGPRAARRVFPADAYDVYFSGRYTDDLASGRESDRIYTGFAVRRGRFDAVTKTDYPALSVVTGGGRPTRWGTEILVEKGDRRLRLLSVHLKSGCHQGNLVTPGSDACDTLARQRAPLEAWVDQRARESVPFAVLGDFNRRLDRHGQNDHLWGELDDGFPADLDLHRLPSGQESSCWAGTRRHHADPIDFLVFDDRAWALVDPSTAREVDYDPAERDAARGTPSDHCAWVVDLDL